MSTLPEWVRKLSPAIPLKLMKISPGYDELAPTLRGLENNFGSLGTSIYKARNEIRVIPTAQGKIVVKRFGKIFLINRFAYAWIRSSKAKRSYLNAHTLIERGIATPYPISYIEHFKGGLIRDSMYIYAYYEGEDNMRRVLKEKDYPDRENLLCSFARYAYSLLQKEVFHKDFSPGNILFEKKDSGYLFTLIDINRMQFGPVTPEKSHQVFRRLFADEATLRILAEAFASASQEDAASVTETMIGYSRRFIARKTRKKKIKKWLHLS